MQILHWHSFHAFLTSAWEKYQAIHHFELFISLKRHYFIPYINKQVQQGRTSVHSVASFRNTANWCNAVLILGDVRHVGSTPGHRSHAGSKPCCDFVYDFRFEILRLFVGWSFMHISCPIFVSVIFVLLQRTRWSLGETAFQSALHTVCMEIITRRLSRILRVWVCELYRVTHSRINLLLFSVHVFHMPYISCSQTWTANLHLLEM